MLNCKVITHLLMNMISLTGITKGGYHVISPGKAEDKSSLVFFFLLGKQRIEAKELENVGPTVSGQRHLQFQNNASTTVDLSVLLVSGFLLFQREVFQFNFQDNAGDICPEQRSYTYSFVRGP